MCLSSVVLMKSVLDKFKVFDKSLKVFDIRLQNSLGSMPCFSADLWIFKPCSSVPVRNCTEKPSFLLKRAKKSATIDEYA